MNDLQSATPRRRLDVWAALLATAVLAFAASAGAESLHDAAGDGDVAEVARLLDAGADPNASTGNGMTPLHRAASEGHHEVVRLLLDRGADPNARNSFGKTRLHYAASGGNVEIVRLLLARSADPNARSEYHEEEGWTPLHYAVSVGNVEVARLLLDAGADLEAHAELGPRWRIEPSPIVTPLVMAAWHSLPEVVALLLDRGADPNARDGDGLTSLHNALYIAADREERNKIEAYIMHYAESETIDESYVEVVRLLLDAGADPNARDEDGETPLDRAVLDGYDAAAALLRERGVHFHRRLRVGWRKGWSSPGRNGGGSSTG